MQKNLKQRSLVFPVVNEYILLGLKKEGFGANKYNGFGGKFDSSKGDVTIEDTAVRELEEESKIKTKKSSLEKMAVIDFYFPYKPELDQQVHIYFLRKINNKPKETIEMAPMWFSLEEIPYENNKMWDSDKRWLKILLKGEKIEGVITWKQDNETVDTFNYKIVKGF